MDVDRYATREGVESMETFETIVGHMLNDNDVKDELPIYGLRVRFYSPCLGTEYTILWSFLCRDERTAKAAKHIVMNMTSDDRLVTKLLKINPDACPHSVPVAARIVRLAEIPF